MAGHQIPVLSERDPAAIDWAGLGVSLVFESTGRFRAPRLGVNDAAYNPHRHDIVSAASCTTNCVFGWYDNELGCTSRLVDLAAIIAARP